MKLLKANHNKEVIKACKEYFCFRLPSDLIKKTKKKKKSIENNYNNHSNLLCSLGV